MAYVSQDLWSGQSRGWRYLAQRIDGSGTQGAWLDNELPLQGVQLTDVLSGPTQLQAVIDPEVARLIGSDGQPILSPWQTVIHAECDGIIRGSVLLETSQFQGPQWTLTGTGYSGYAKNMAYEGNITLENYDPLDVVRLIWETIQSQQNSNLGLVVDATTHTPIRVGTIDSNGNGAYPLNWWTNTDLGNDIDTLAQNTPFDYHDRAVWSSDRTQVFHYLDFGYPLIGRRRDDLRFVLGENIQVMPEVDSDGDDFANHVMVLGAGTGSAQIHAEARNADGRLRRMVVVSNSALTDLPSAQAVARVELAMRAGLTTITTCLVRDTPSVPLGSWGVGDQIRIGAETNWMDVDLWFQVISIQYQPDTPDIASMSLLRSDLRI